MTFEQHNDEQFVPPQSCPTEVWLAMRIGVSKTDVVLKYLVTCLNLNHFVRI
jgi:hypothetical protein